MKRAVLTVALTLAVVGGVLIWLRAPLARHPSAPPVEVPPEIERSRSSLQTIAESSRQVSPAPNPTMAKPNVLDRLNVVPNSVGSITKRSSPNFEWYIAIVSVGAFVERNDTPMTAAFQDIYELSSEDLKSVVDYSLGALRSDREFQADERRRLCMQRAEFHSLDSLGHALHDSDTRIEANQERLGREAEGALSAATFSKINAQIAKRPPGDVTVADYPALFAARHPDLAEEIGRLCDTVR